MLKPKATRQFRHLVGHGLRLELADPERIVAPVLLAVTLLVLFSFAVGEVDASMRPRLFVAETYLSLFFALQVAFARLFDQDRQDRVHEVTRTYPVAPAAWFLAKTIVVIVMGATTLVPTVLVAALLNQAPGGPPG